MTILAALSATLVLQPGIFQSGEIRSMEGLERAFKQASAPNTTAMRNFLGASQLPKGVAKIEGRRVAFAIDGTGAKKVVVKCQPGGQTFVLNQQGGFYAGIFEFQPKDAFRAEFYVDDVKSGDTKQFEIYDYPPEMSVNPDVPKGELREMPKLESKVYPGTSSEWWAYKPAKAQPEGGYGFIVFQDGQWAKNYAVPCLDNLIAKGDIPPLVAIFIKPSESATGQSIRMRQYDYLTDEYVRFILDEYEPAVAAALGVKISQDPSVRAIAGLSSGGICAWTAAWERPDKFGLVLSWIGSFTNIASRESKREGGHNYPALIRKMDKKPIRVFLQDGDQDLDNEHGNWFLSNLQMVASLKFKGYDYRWEPGHGYHSDAHGRSLMPDALRWLFRK
ncbi:MAG TPA: alpha/beta hydrolase-fold protein [Fimbriimonas sp.]|nr:alpha/beta hydrolase-fold protein [Fimbriimonas sp.]